MPFENATMSQGTLQSAFGTHSSCFDSHFTDGYFVAKRSALERRMPRSLTLTVGRKRELSILEDSIDHRIKKKRVSFISVIVSFVIFDTMWNQLGRMSRWDVV